MKTKLFRLGASTGMLALVSAAGGCSTYYDNLMTNQQLIAASCSDLAAEQEKIQSNINASNEGSLFNVFGAVATAFVEADAGTDGTATAAVADGAGADMDLASSWSQKKDLIDRLRAKKGC